VSTRSVPELRTLEELVSQAEYDLYRNECVDCHQIDLDAVPYPRVAPPGLRSRRWLGHARFSHASHLASRTCADCHPAAATSTRTSDVLLPSIAVCRPCHGGGPGETGETGETDRGLAAAARPAGGTAANAGGVTRMRCVDCHSYHPPDAAVGAAKPCGAGEAGSDGAGVAGVGVAGVGIAAAGPLAAAAASRNAGGAPPPERATREGP